jgi:hypothetical protein
MAVARQEQELEAVRLGWATAVRARVDLQAVDRARRLADLLSVGVLLPEPEGRPAAQRVLEEAIVREVYV